MSSFKLGHNLMKVPKLDVSSTNWVIYKDRFTWAIDARGLLEHLDGSGKEPTRPILKGKKAGESSKETDPIEEDFMVVEGLSVEDEKKLNGWKEKL
jgi:hypothetical protein